MTTKKTADHVAEIESEGYTIVEDVIDAGKLATISADLLRLEEELKVTPHNNPFEGKDTVRIYNLLVHGELYGEFALHPRTLPIVEGVLSSSCLISSLSSIAIRGGEAAQPIHADDQVIPLKKPHRAIVCNTMWAITDFTEENGATRIIPGSHKRDHNPAFGTKYESQAAEMKAGSVMVFNGSMWHGGGANQTDQRRVGVAMNYCAGYIRQQENQQLGVPQELVKTMPKRLQELIGYSVYRGLIGHLDHGHPGKLLKD
jgi:ectoine hydroxylase-related dioxygenase (phytanoyl-CoA dioxygenase family)